MGFTSTLKETGFGGFLFLLVIFFANSFKIRLTIILICRVAKLDLRDAGTWVCEIGSSTSETFQVQTKEFVIDIESKTVEMF